MNAHTSTAGTANTQPSENKTITIDPSLFVVHEKKRSRTPRTKKNTSSHKPLFNAAQLKQTLLQRVQAHRNREKTALDQSPASSEQDVASAIAFLSMLVDDTPPATTPAPAPEAMPLQTPEPMPLLSPATAPTPPPPRSILKKPSPPPMIAQLELKPTTILQPSPQLPPPPSLPITPNTVLQPSSLLITPTTALQPSPIPITPTTVLQPSPMPNANVRDEDILLPFQMDNVRMVPYKQTRTKTIRRSYTLGKGKQQRAVGVLISDRKTRKRITDLQREWKRTSIADMKQYLKQRNLLKVGSHAPNDVVQQMYEAALASGEISNQNAETMLHNATEM